MPLEPYPELAALNDAYLAIERDARALADGLTDDRAAWREHPASWSVAECVDHLATANRIYLAAMEPPAARARAGGRMRRQPALPGMIGGWFVGTLEPPVKTRTKRTAPDKIRPRTSPPFADAMTAFLKSQEDARRFLQIYAGIDLAGVRFPNPFVRAIRFSLATGLHVIAAHDRRHLAQAWRVRKAAEERE
jgi:DinB family protein